MEEMINIIITNGIGVGSFIALLFFVNNYISKMNDTVNNIANTLTSIKDSLVSLSTRVDEIESKVNNK